MANTTFNGPVRSQNGFQDISIDATTGTVTTDSTYATDATVGGSARVADGISNKTGVVAATGTILQMANGFAAAMMVKNTHYLTPAMVTRLQQRYQHKRILKKATQLLLITTCLRLTDRL